LVFVEIFFFEVRHVVRPNIIFFFVQFVQSFLALVDDLRPEVTLVEVDLFFDFELIHISVPVVAVVVVGVLELCQINPALHFYVIVAYLLEPLRTWHESRVLGGHSLLGLTLHTVGVIAVADEDRAQ